jgi:hypothetical protein
MASASHSETMLPNPPAKLAMPSTQLRRMTPETKLTGLPSSLTILILSHFFERVWPVVAVRYHW